MALNALLSNIKTGLFFLLYVLYSVAHGQSSLSSTATTTLPINLQEKSITDSERTSADADRKLTSEDTFSVGKGYLIQVPTDHPTVPTPFKGLFSGVPNNGTMHIEMKAGYNMVGNPYPSGINVHDFIESNPAITGTLYFLKKNRRYATATSYATLTKTAYVTNGTTEEDASIGYFEAGDESNWFLTIAQGFFINATMDSNLVLVA